jgi:hypothetical protein
VAVAHLILVTPHYVAMNRTTCMVLAMSIFALLSAGAAEATLLPKKLVVFGGGSWTDFYHVELDTTVVTSAR